MTPKTSIILRKHNVGWNNQTGSSSVILLSLIMFIALLFVFLNIADYAVYSEKRDIIAKSIDYAVTAAVQEVDTTASKSGLAQAYDPVTGQIQLKSIYLNETLANNAFYSTFNANTNIERTTIENRALVVLVNPQQSNLQYIIKSSAGRITGTVSTPEQLQTVINNKLNTDSVVIGGTDKHIIYVNGNVKTVKFKERPYYLVVIRNLPVRGLFRSNDTTFVSFKGANIERNVEN